MNDNAIVSKHFANDVCKMNRYKKIPTSSISKVELYAKRNQLHFLSISDKWKACKKWAVDNVLGSSITVSGFGKIEFSSTFIRKDFGHRSSPALPKIASFAAIKEIISIAQYLGEENTEKVNQPKSTNFFPT